MSGQAVETDVPKVRVCMSAHDDRRIYRPVSTGRRVVQSILHISILACAGCLWFWHLGHVAAKQPIAQKYGWFSNYMTFDALTLQLIQYVLVLPADLFKSVPVWWRRFIDDLGCAVFGPVLFVTLSFYCVELLPMNPLYGDDYQVMNAFHQDQPACYARNICVPAWVPIGLHVGNSIAAVMDLLVCIQHRTFSRRAELLQTGFTLSYVLWLMVCRYRSGVFPYPFMEELPLPWGFVLTSIFMITSCELLFGFGKRVRSTLMQVRRPYPLPGSLTDDQQQLQYESYPIVRPARRISRSGIANGISS